MKYLFVIVAALLLSSCIHPAQSYMVRELETKSNELHWARGQMFQQKREIIQLKQKEAEQQKEIYELKMELWVRDVGK